MVIYLFWKRNVWAWYIVALEIILGGAGGFLAIGPLALRTCLLLVSILYFFGDKIHQKKLSAVYLENKTFSRIILFLYVVVAYASIRGLTLGHDVRAVFADAIPYLFFLYYYPLRELLTQDKFKTICYSALGAAVLGNALFIMFSLAGFSSGTFILQGEYYHWFRDVALGKITDLGGGFFRIVLNEHLLLIPVLLFFVYKAIQNRPHPLPYILFSLPLFFILSVNLTRIYMIALAVGLIFLFIKAGWKRWFAYCAGSAITFVLIFSLTHMLATGGRSIGWEIFGLRLQSVVQPQIEDSSLSRMLLLPKILEKIQEHAVLGNGLADTVTVYSPVFKKEISTGQFDWGYLELWAELGILGIGIWLYFLVYSVRSIVKSKINDWQYLISAISALAVTNLTSPALFHVLGIVCLFFLSALFFKNSTSQSPSEVV